MIDPSTVRLLVVSRTEEDRAYMEDFFRHTDFARPDFVVGKSIPADRYDFIVFDAHSLEAVPTLKAFTELPENIQAHYFLLERYLRDTSLYILFFGKIYHNLNQERCPSANSKFTLFARLRELIEFINFYRTDAR